MKIFIQQHTPLKRILILIVISGLMLSSCFPSLPSPDATITPIVPTATETPTPMPTSTLPPFGEAGNPVRLAVVSEEFDQEQLDAAINLADRLAQLTGYAIQAEMFSSYQEIIDGLRDQKIQIAFLPPLTYLLAQRRNQARVALLANNFGVYQYGTQFLARSDSPFSIYYDPQSNQSTAEADIALRQFEAHRPCLTEPISISGYILPTGLLSQYQVATAPAVVTQSHTSVIRALYAGGLCDFGATFAYTGDARTASSLSDLAEVDDEIVVVWQSEAVIPNTNISFHPHLAEEISLVITDAFLEIASTEAGLATMTSAVNYEIQALKIVDESIYDPLRGIVRQAQTDLNSTIGR
jgi:phosphonate transport system substrate-binding protein